VSVAIPGNDDRKNKKRSLFEENTLLPPLQKLEPRNIVTLRLASISVVAGQLYILQVTFKYLVVNNLTGRTHEYTVTCPEEGKSVAGTSYVTGGESQATTCFQLTPDEFLTQVSCTLHISRCLICGIEFITNKRRLGPPVRSKWNGGSGMRGLEGKFHRGELEKVVLGPYGGGSHDNKLPMAILGLKLAYSDRVPNPTGPSKYAGIGGICPILCQVADVNSKTQNMGSDSEESYDDDSYDSEDTPPQYKEQNILASISNKDIFLPMETTPYLVDNTRVQEMEKLDEQLLGKKGLLQRGNFIQRTQEEARIANQLALEEEYKLRETERMKKSARRVDFKSWQKDNPGQANDFMNLSPDLALARVSTSSRNFAFSDDESFDDYENVNNSGRMLLRYGLGL